MKNLLSYIIAHTACLGTSKSNILVKKDMGLRNIFSDDFVFIMKPISTHFEKPVVKIQHKTKPTLRNTHRMGAAMFVAQQNIYSSD